MDEKTVKLLNKLDIFADLSKDEINIISKLAEAIKFETDAVIFKEGDEGGGFYLVLKGAVKITTFISEGLDKTLLIVRPGAVFGELSLIDAGDRSATASAQESSEVMFISRETFESMLKDHPLISSKILHYLARTVSDRLRTTTDLYRRNIEWGLQVSGALQLNFHRLITDRVEMHLQLITGRELTGMLMKVEQSSAGYELVIKTPDEKFIIIPYHAVMMMSFDTNVVKGQDSEISPLL